MNGGNRRSIRAAHADKGMRVSLLTAIFALGLLFLAAPAQAALAGGGLVDKPAVKETGIISVKTTPQAYPVKIDGRYVGRSGVTIGTEFAVSPGMRQLEVVFPNGKSYVRKVEVRRNAKNCVCLNYVEKTVTRPCPYDVTVDAPAMVADSELITFSANNVGGAPDQALKYVWRVTPADAVISSGQGTPTITVDSSGFGGRVIKATLDVSTGFNDEACKQTLTAQTEVSDAGLLTPKRFQCDEFELENLDAFKARIDNCVIKVQTEPDGQLYVIIYPGTDRISLTRNTFEKTAARAREYLIQTRNVDPSRITIVQGPTRPRTVVQVWVIPPGAPLPVPE